MSEKEKPSDKKKGKQSTKGAPKSEVKLGQGFVNIPDLSKKFGVNFNFPKLSAFEPSSSSLFNAANLIPSGPFANIGNNFSNVDFYNTGLTAGANIDTLLAKTGWLNNSASFQIASNLGGISGFSDTILKTADSISGIPDFYEPKTLYAINSLQGRFGAVMEASRITDYSIAYNYVPGSFSSVLNFMETSGLQNIASSFSYLNNIDPNSLNVSPVLEEAVALSNKAFKLLEEAEVDKNQLVEDSDLLQIEELLEELGLNQISTTESLGHLIKMGERLLENDEIRFETTQTTIKLQQDILAENKEQTQLLSGMSKSGNTGLTLAKVALIVALLNLFISYLAISSMDNSNDEEPSESSQFKIEKYKALNEKIEYTSKETTANVKMRDKPSSEEGKVLIIIPKGESVLKLYSKKLYSMVSIRTTELESIIGWVSNRYLR